MASSSLDNVDLGTATASLQATAMEQSTLLAPVLAAAAGTSMIPPLLRVPPEILSIILDIIQSDKDYQFTLHSLSLCCKTLHPWVTPYLYHTIKLHMIGILSAQPLRQLNRLVRSILENPELASYIRCVDFEGPRMHMRRRAGIKREYDRRGLLVEKYDGNVRARGLGEKRMVELVDRLDTLSEREREVAKELGRKIVDIAGYQDASIALLLILIARAPGPGIGNSECKLRELRIVLGTDDTEGQLQVLGAPKKTGPEDCLWKALHTLSFKAGDDGRVPFPKLKKVEVKAVRILPQTLMQEEEKITDIVHPFFRLPSLEHFSLSAFDRVPILWFPSTSVPWQLKSLTLRNVQVDSLSTILYNTPKLTSLDYTLMQNLSFERHRFATYICLGNALSHVKNTLTTLSLYNFIYDRANGDPEILIDGAGFSGDPCTLRLYEFPKLRKLTTSLRILLGPMGNNSRHWERLKDALPEGLEELRLLEDKGGFINFDIWFFQLERAAELVRKYILDRGTPVAENCHGLDSDGGAAKHHHDYDDRADDYGDGDGGMDMNSTGYNGERGKLRKIVFLLEFMLERRSRPGDEYDDWRWPSVEDFRELKEVGKEFGVEVERQNGLLLWECEEFQDRAATEEE